MDFENIFNEALKLYPKQINISDGILFDNDESFSSKNLIKYYENAEQSTLVKGEWHSLLVWIIFQVLHGTSKEKFRAKIFTFNIDINKQKFRKYLIRNLDMEEYSDLKREFLDFEKNNDFLS